MKQESVGVEGSLKNNCMLTYILLSLFLNQTRVYLNFRIIEL